VEKEKERKQQEDAQWQIRKAEDAKRYDEICCCGQGPGKSG